MVQLKRWFDTFMVFANRKKDENLSLSIDGVLIERLSEFRFLSVTLDDNLTWKSQIAHG